MQRHRRNIYFVLSCNSSVSGSGCTPEVGGLDCPIYCCVAGMFPVAAEATTSSERSESAAVAAVDHDYIENEVSAIMAICIHLKLVYK